VGIEKNHLELNSQTRTESTSSHNRDYLTREQVADLLQVCTRTISDMTAKGVIIAIKMGSGRNSSVRYSRDTLENSIRKMERS